MTDSYKAGLKVDESKTLEYYHKSLETKTEQQKFLEKLLHGFTFNAIADIACGGGTLSYHLAKLYPQAQFTLIDDNEIAVAEAKRNNPAADVRFQSIYQLDLPPQDLVCCWQTISWIDDPKNALEQLLRITRPGGRVYASSLFNLDHDVDIYARLYDHTRESGRQGIGYSYNTYSQRSILEWTRGLCSSVEIVPFHLPINLPKTTRGIGTYTHSGLQVTAGYLLNWGVLILIK